MIDKIKEKIKSNFNKSFLNYDQSCCVQNKITNTMLEFLLKYARVFDRVADFACGTGESTLRLMNSIQYNNCFAVDFSEQLLTIAKSKLPSHVGCVLADFDKIIFDNHSLDLVFCNMGLQWSLDLLKNMLLFNEYLAPQGCIAFSLPIDNNFPELKSSYKITVQHHHEIVTTLSSANFELLEFNHVDYVERFLSPVSALRSIKNVGATGCISSNHHRDFGLARSYINNMFINPGLPQLTYKVGIYIARKQ